MTTEEVAAPQTGPKHLRANEKKWSKEVLDPGWSLIPNIILIKQHALGLEPVDINILLQIGKHWWREDDRPYPSQKTLAREMNIDISTVKRHLARLRSEGFIDWKPRERRRDKARLSNAYDLSGLIKKLRPYAIAEMTERRDAAEKKKALAQRKRPTLHVVAPPKDAADD